MRKVIARKQKPISLELQLTAERDHYKSQIETFERTTAKKIKELSNTIKTQDKQKAAQYKKFIVDRRELIRILNTVVEELRKTYDYLDSENIKYNTRLPPALLNKINELYKVSTELENQENSGDNGGLSSNNFISCIHIDTLMKRF